MKEDHQSTMASRGHASGPEAAAHLEHPSQSVKALEDVSTFSYARMLNSARTHKEIVAYRRYYRQRTGENG